MTTRTGRGVKICDSNERSVSRSNKNVLPRIFRMSRSTSRERIAYYIKAVRDGKRPCKYT